MQWSPDGRTLLLIMATAPCMPETETAVVLVDSEGQTAATLVAPQARRYSIEEWLSDEVVLLRDGEEAAWRLALSSGEVSGQ